MNRSITFLRRFIPQKTRRSFSNKVEEINENEPIKFSTSPASKRSVMIPTIKRNRIDFPWYQPYSVTISTTIFLLYFCVFREESDIDGEFIKTLYSRVEGLEKEQLLLSYKYNKENGLSVADIEKRLKEIELEETKAAVV